MPDQPIIELHPGKLVAVQLHTPDGKVLGAQNVVMTGFTFDPDDSEYKRLRLANPGVMFKRPNPKIVITMEVLDLSASALLNSNHEVTFGETHNSTPPKKRNA